MRKLSSNIKDTLYKRLAFQPIRALLKGQCCILSMKNHCGSPLVESQITGLDDIRSVTEKNFLRHNCNIAWFMEYHKLEGIYLHHRGTVPSKNLNLRIEKLSWYIVYCREKTDTNYTYCSIRSTVCTLFVTISFFCEESVFFMNCAMNTFSNYVKNKNNFKKLLYFVTYRCPIYLKKVP